MSVCTGVSRCSVNPDRFDVMIYAVLNCCFLVMLAFSGSEFFYQAGKQQLYSCYLLVVVQLARWNEIVPPVQAQSDEIHKLAAVGASGLNFVEIHKLY